jgi:hypothetical protein
MQETEAGDTEGILTNVQMRGKRHSHKMGNRQLFRLKCMWSIRLWRVHKLGLKTVLSKLLSVPGITKVNSEFVAEANFIINRDFR